MKLPARDLVQTALICVLAIGQVRAQQSTAEKHVADIKAEQSPSAISASPLCDRVRAKDNGEVHNLPVDASSLEPDLTSLMQKSDEVVLAGIRQDMVYVLAPSGEDAISYYDVRVLRSWKGPHKAGDLLTFALPEGWISCWSEPGNDRPSMTVLTRPGRTDWRLTGPGPYLLFLRHSTGNEVPPLSGLRLTGGNGIQGLFSLDSTYTWFCTGMESRYGMYRESIARCNAMLYASAETVKIPYSRDPLNAKYGGMPVPKLLQEVQDVSDSFLSDAERRYMAAMEQRYSSKR